MPQEELLYQTWLAAYRARRILSGPAGQLQILDPGRLNRQAGPDFRSARFLWNGVVYQGDVEMHREAADWYRHGHHFDPAYQNVLLHLITSPHTGRPWVRHELSQREIPSFVLTELAPAGILNCPLAEIPADLTVRLNHLALLRFRQLTRYWQNELQRLSVENALYQGLLKVCGYARNQAPFRELAIRLPWEEVQRMRTLFGSGFDDFLSLFLFQSGLSAPAGHDNGRGEYLSQLLGLPGNKISGWQNVGRPANYPLPRLAALAAWLSTQNSQIWNELGLLLRERKPFYWLNREMYRCFRLKSAAPLHPGSGIKPGAGQYLWGKQRFREFMVNVFVPLQAALALPQSGAGFEAYLEQAFIYFSRQKIYSSYNAVLYWLNQPGLDHEKLPVQGIIHLFKEYCQQQFCRVCPLAGSFSAEDESEN